MGVGSSRVTLPPGATLDEVTNRELDGPMQFCLGLAATIPARLTARLIQTFDIEKRRYIQRVRRVDEDFNDVILSYNAEDRDEVIERLQDLSITVPLIEVPLPLWCPLSARHRTECAEYWPVNYVFAPQPPDPEPISGHTSWIEKVFGEKSILIKKPDGNFIVASDAQSDCDHCDGHIDHGMLRALAAASKYAAENGSYLCTNLDVYCYLEPCVMCAMAMVHSRVGRLFYVQKNPDFGGIESQAQVHSNPHLNHNFRAFRVRL
jgi:tRNA-specific adenosine deaminase 3